VDVWALGVTLYALLYGQLPWDLGEREGRLDVMQQITDKAIAFPDTVAAADDAALPMPNTDLSTTSSDEADVAEDPAASRTGGDSQYVSDTSPSATDDVSGSGSGFSPSRHPGDNSAATSSVAAGTRASGGGHPSSDVPPAARGVQSMGWPRLLKGMLQRDPSKRLTLAAVRRRVIDIERACASSSPQPHPADPHRDRHGPAAGSAISAVHRRSTRRLDVANTAATTARLNNVTVAGAAGQS